VQFRLLIEREDPVRGEVVLNATRDAINALVGGLEFDVEDEQVASEVLLERQLARELSTPPSGRRSGRDCCRCRSPRISTS
jgi:hypothetical protein